MPRNLTPEHVGFLKDYSSALQKTIRLQIELEAEPLNFTPKEAFTYLKTLKAWVTHQGLKDYLKVVSTPRYITRIMQRKYEKAYLSMRRLQKKEVNTETFIADATDWYLYVSEQLSEANQPSKMEPKWPG